MDGAPLGGVQPGVQHLVGHHVLDRAAVFPEFAANSALALPHRSKVLREDEASAWHARGVVVLTTNKAIEDAAIAWVLELERATGRRPHDTRYSGAAADIDSPPRLIEVKAFGITARGFELLMEGRQVEEARSNPNFYVYVVENVRQGDPAEFSLRVLGGSRLQRLLQRAKEYRGYTVPWPVADYDAGPLGLDG